MAYDLEMLKQLRQIADDVVVMARVNAENNPSKANLDSWEVALTNLERANKLYRDALMAECRNS